MQQRADMIYTEISGTGKRRGREMGNESEKEVRKGETRWGKEETRNCGH